MVQEEATRCNVLMGNLDFSVQVETLQNLLVSKAYEWKVMKPVEGTTYSWTFDVDELKVYAIKFHSPRKTKLVHLLQIMFAAPTKEWKAKISAWSILADRFINAMAAGIKSKKEFPKPEPKDTCGDPQ